MRFPKLAAVVAATGGALVLGLFAANPAVADTTTSYQANLQSINGSGASGTLMITLNGTQATVTEKASGLAASFNGSPYPHVQHIHIGAKGQCPTMAADTNGDGVISTTEGAPWYGPIGATLSTSGPTSPAAGTVLNIAPSGSTIDYSRTFALDDKTVASIKAGTGVIVVHGLDPSKLSAKAQAEKSDLVPSLPLAATSPALCGSVTAAQTTAVPTGGATTGGGGTSSPSSNSTLLAGLGLLAGAALLLGARKFVPARARG